MLERLRRVTDLFIDGTELPLGEDESGPILIWVAKLNSFQLEEARRDGVSARALRTIELQKEDNPQRIALEVEMRRWSDDELRQHRVDQSYQDRYLEAINDLEADEEWREKILTLRRMPELLQGAPPDDPRHEQLTELNAQYIARLREVQDEKNAEALQDLAGEPIADVREAFIEAWIEQLTLDVYMADRRRTELFYAMRDCRATRIDNDQGPRWNHGQCDHTQRFLESRDQVGDLPEELIGKVIDVIDGITVPERDAGNSDAPASSSTSSEQPSDSAASAPSIPEVTPSAPATT